MATQTSPAQLPRRFIKIAKVQDWVGMSKSEIYRRVADGRFPAQITLGPKSVVWDEGQIIAWMEERVAESQGAAA